MPRRPPVPDILACLAVFAVSVGYAVVTWQAGGAVGIHYPLGSDGPIWFDSARLAAAGEPVGMPPMYPRLLSALSRGPPRLGAALSLNGALVALTLLGAAATAALAAAAASPWSRRAAALGAPLVVLAAGDPAAYAWYIHPEPLITAALVWVGAAAVAAVRWPGAWTAAALGLCCGVALGAKEHGLVTLLLAPAVVWLAAPGAGGRWRRLSAWGLVLAPFLVSQLLDGALFAKAWEAVSESLGWLGQDPGSMAVLPIEMSDEQQQQVRDGGLIGMSARQMLTASQTWWPAYGGAALGLAGLLAARRWRLLLALALPLATLAPALVLWTEPRHYLVVAPAAATVAVAAAGCLARSWRTAAALLGGCLLAAALLAPGASRRLDTTLRDIATLQAERGDEYDALMWLIANLDIADRVLLEVDPVVLGKLPFMPIPRGQPLRPESLPADAYMVTSRSAPLPWELAQTTGALRIYRLRR